MNRYLALPLIVLLTAADTPPLPDALLPTRPQAHAMTAPAPSIDGRYCGKIQEQLQGGRRVLTDVVTTLATDMDGITGSYTLNAAADNGRELTGRLRGVQTNGPTKILTWTDKDGSGPLVITFNADFSQFKGNFGGASEAKIARPWTGRQCP